MRKRGKIIIEKIRQKRIQKERIFDTVLNGNEHDDIDEKYDKYNSKFITIISFIIVMNIITMIISAVSDRPIFLTILRFSSFISFLMFLAEFLSRLFAAPATFPKSSRIRSIFCYIFSYMGIIDILSILPFIIPIIFLDEQNIFNSTNAYLAVIFIVSLMLKIVRYFKTFRFILSVFNSVKKELIFGIIMAAIVVVISGTLMYYVERDAQPEKFCNIGEGFWWSIITFATVGYGDIYPITTLGKIIAAFISMIGIGTIALPSGIISSAFIKAMNDKEAKKNIDEKIKGKPSDTVVLEQTYCGYCGQKHTPSPEKPFCIYCGNK